MKFTLEKKILAGFVSCAIVLLVVALISFSNSEKFLETNRWVNHTQEVLYEFEQILVNSINAETGTRGYIITNDDSYLEPYNAAKLSLAEHIAKAKQLTIDNPQQQRNINAVEDLLNKRVVYLNTSIELRKSKGFEDARELILSGEGKKLQDEVRNILNNAKKIEVELLNKRKLESDTDARNFNILFIVLLVVIVIVLIAVYIIIMANLRALKKAETETANKNWSLNGSRELAKSIEGNIQVSDLAQTIINHLANYLNAQIGAFYIRGENDGTSLRLAGGFALDKKIKDEAVVEFGNGIVGQAALEKKSIYLTNIPTDYFTITSSFGNVVPKNILAVPFIHEEKVIGVIELGSLHAFTELQKQYLDFILNNVAIAVMASQSRQKTKELLEETQRQAEELEAQQEELRQSNEELHVKTQLLEESELELKTQQAELVQTNEELNQKADMLEDQKEELETAKTEIEIKANEIEITSKYKSEFLANMSHELRTPLNSILILAQLLAENKTKKLEEKEVEFARNIYNSGSDLLNLINEILDLSKVEAGKIQLDVEEVSFQNIVSNLSALFSEVAKNRSIDFRIRLDDKNLAPTFSTDKQRIEQILKNLLSNAFKFTNKGGTIELTIGKPETRVAFRNSHLNSTPDCVAFSVSDTGIGIPEDKRGLIFEAFQQADGSTKRKYGGTGLGLSISRELSLALGGEIHLQSEEGKGSTFTLYLPLRFDSSFIAPMEKKVEIKESRKKIHAREERSLLVPEQDIDDDRNSIRENDRVILIIEDDEPFARVLLDFIRERNYKGVIARQGNTGLSYARHFKPDAILLDMNLPVMDGTEVLKHIKNDPNLRHTPVQIISSYDLKKESKKLGAFDFIQKPVSSNDLLLAFDKIENFTSKKIKKLLIVEDNEQQNHAIRELIGNNDVNSFSAYRGTDAYEMLENGSYDCVIVDLGLPDMSGIELLEKIRANEKLNKIPIVVYTGKDLKKEENAYLSKLADTIVLKTADSHERLLDETILFLHRVESRLPQEKQSIIRKLHKADEVLKNKRVLLVDDDMRNIYSLTNALEEEGVTCITAENGKIALTKLTENPSIDLILMDIMMPEMDGFEATVEIRKKPGFEKIPIIALTAKAMKGDKEKCLAVGMSDYVSKPVDMVQLLSLMRVWLYR